MRTIVLLSLLAAVPSLAATDPCGGVTIEDGAIKTGHPLTGNPKEDDCLKAVAEAVKADKSVGGVTVELRTKDDDRVGGKALNAAKHAAQVLVASGLPANSVWPLVPRADGLELGLVLVPTMAPEGPPVAQLAETFGTVRAGKDEASSKATARGAAFSPGALVSTRDGGAVLRFPDAGDFTLRPDTQLKISAASDGRPSVALHAGRLNVETVDGPGVVVDLGASKLIVNAFAKATVERSGDDWNVSVFSGTAGYFGTQGTVTIAARHGLSGKGDAPSAPVLLLLPPRATPTFGKPLADGALHWSEMKGAASYRVEISPDASFGAKTFTTVSPTAGAKVAPPSPSSAGFFWRVFPVDSSGVTGEPSKVNRFSLPNS